MIIHTCKTMTVKQYSGYEATKDGRLLYQRGWRWLPPSWFVDDRQAFIDEFNSLFNESGDDYLMDAWEQFEAHNRIMLLRALLQAVHVHTVTRAEMELLAKKHKYKLQPDKKLTYFIDELRSLGYEVKSLEDVVQLRDEVQRKIDKYNEKYNKAKDKKQITIIELFTAACRVLEVTHDYSKVTLWEFAQIKRQAEEHTRRMEQYYNKNRNDG